MPDFLTNLDPTLIAGAVAAILALFKHRKDGDLQTYLKTALESALRRKVLELIERHLTGAQARAELEAEAAAVLARVGIKRSAVVDMLLHSVTEAALHYLEERLFRVRDMKKATGELADGAQKALDAFEPSEEPTIPRALDGIQFEEIKDSGQSLEQVYGKDPDERAEQSAAKVRAAIAKAPPR